jgi:hypothetical protein
VAIRNRPILTDVYESPGDFAPEAPSTYLYAWSGEERSHHFRRLVGDDVRVLEVLEQNDSDMLIARGSEKLRLPLRSERQLRDLFVAEKNTMVYLDITGLVHHVWAPLLKAAIAASCLVRAVYVEPAEYTLSINPTEGAIFDLSEKITGIRPIPGFASLAQEEEDRSYLVALLGFEGPRFAYVIEQVQPPGGRIIPIAGIPGFRPQYPFYTYMGNRFPLQDTLAWRDIRYVAANCPFSLYYALEDIAADNPGDAMKIAPIGTKPHALGAVLFCLAQSLRPVELVYDHPVRKSTRTTGTARLLVYDLSAFFTSTRPL